MSAVPVKGGVDSSSAASPLICSRSGAQVVEIAQLLLAVVSRALIEREQLPDGIRLRLRASDETEAALREYVTREKACCPFLDLSVERRGGELLLEVHGPAEAGPILALLSQLASRRQGVVTTGSRLEARGDTPASTSILTMSDAHPECRLTAARCRMT